MTQSARKEKRKKTIGERARQAVHTKPKRSPCYPIIISQDRDPTRPHWPARSSLSHSSDAVPTARPASLAPCRLLAPAGHSARAALPRRAHNFRRSPAAGATG